MPGEQTDRGEVLEVLVVGNNVDRSFRTFEIVPPSGKRLKYSEEFLVVSVIIQFGDAQGAGMKAIGWTSLSAATVERIAATV